MRYSSPQQHRRTNDHLGNGARFDELGLYGLYESPHLQSSFLVDRIDNAGEVMLAARRNPEYDEDGHEIEGTAETQLDAYWIGASLRTTQARDIDPVDLTDEDLEHLPLEARERVKGLQRERRRHREKALAAHLVGIDRETRHREALISSYRERRRVHEATRVVTPERGRHHTDPFEDLDDGEAAGVRDAARHLNERLVSGPSIEALEHRLAQKVTRGQDLISATSNLQDELYQEAGVIQPIAEVPAVPSRYNVEADIQGEVTTLWQPKASNQQQVGLIADDSGQLKFTVWTLSNQDVILREGDTIRIVGGKVGVYKGQATLAADSKTLITVIERGDGPAPRGDIANVEWSKYGDRDGGQRPRPCTPPSNTNPGVTQVSLPTHRPRNRLDGDGGRYAATHWLNAVEIYDDDGDVPLPEWWKDQPNVLRIDVPRGADAATVNDLIAEHRRFTQPGDIPTGSTESRAVGGGAHSQQQPSAEAGTYQPDSEAVLAADGGDTRTLWVKLPAEGQGSENAGEAECTDTVVGAPSTRARCPVCAHDRAYYELKQLRAADEPPTRLLTCSGCGHHWRENA